MKSTKKPDPWLFNSISMMSLAPELDPSAWEKAEVDRQPAMQRMKARDFGVGDETITPARAALAAFAQGKLPSIGELAGALEAMVDPERNALAIKVKCDAYDITDIEATAEDLLEIASLDRNMFRLCVLGRFAEAIRSIKPQGYHDAMGFELWSVSTVLDLVDCLIRYWIADALEVEARKCSNRIFSPTGCEMLDFGDPTKTAGMRAIAKRLRRQLDVAEKVFEIYHRDLRFGGQELKSADEWMRSSLSFRTPNTSCTITAPSALLYCYGRSASEKETQFLRDVGIEAIAQAELKRLRKEHGDQLEAIIEARLDWARRKVAKLYREIDAILDADSGVCRRAYDRWGISPQARLWWACQAAIAWAWPARTDIDTPLDRAVKAIRRGDTIRRPRPHPDNVTRANKLFFALRCTTVQDPEHLPVSLRETDAPALTNGAASIVQLRRRGFTFEEIWAAKKALGTHPGREPYSTKFSEEAVNYVKAHRPGRCTYCRRGSRCPVVDHRWDVAERWLQS